MARIPIWKTIKASLEADIGEGKYGPGDKLPTEAQLATRFGVNRHTVRRAMSEMAETELVVSRRGAGVFVAHVPTEYPLGRRVRFTRNLSLAGRIPDRVLDGIETRASSAREAEALALAVGSPVHVYEGLSRADGRPILLFRSVFPAERLPGLPDALRRDLSITAALKACGVGDYTRASTKLTAKIAHPAQARRLMLRDGAPILRSVSINVDIDGHPVEFGKTWFAGDLVTLTLEPETGTGG